MCKKENSVVGLKMWGRNKKVDCLKSSNSALQEAWVGFLQKLESEVCGSKAAWGKGLSTLRSRKWELKKWGREGNFSEEEKEKEKKNSGRWFLRFAVVVGRHTQRSVLHKTRTVVSVVRFTCRVRAGARGADPSTPGKVAVRCVRPFEVCMGGCQTCTARTLIACAKQVLQLSLLRSLYLEGVLLDCPQHVPLVVHWVLLPVPQRPCHLPMYAVLIQQRARLPLTVRHVASRTANVHPPIGPFQTRERRTFCVHVRHEAAAKPTFQKNQF